MVLNLPVILLSSHWRGLTDSAVTLVRVRVCGPSALSITWVTQPDLGRRLTPIRPQSQRLNIFFIFNRSLIGSSRASRLPGYTYNGARVWARTVDRSSVRAPRRGSPASRKTRKKPAYHERRDIHARAPAIDEITYRRPTSCSMSRRRSPRRRPAMLRAMRPQSTRDRRAEVDRGEGKDIAQCMRDARDDGRVEAERYAGQMRQ